MVFNLSKKDFITGFALSQNLKKTEFDLRCYAEGVLFFWELQESSRVPFYSKFAGIFSKVAF